VPFAKYNYNEVKEDETGRARMGEKHNAYRILVEKPEGKRLLGRPRHRWVHNIKMNVRQDVVAWTGVI
jgi:hypothetical protein